MSALCPCPITPTGGPATTGPSSRPSTYRERHVVHLGDFLDKQADEKFCHSKVPPDLSHLMNPDYSFIKEALGCRAYPEFIFRVEEGGCATVDIKTSTTIKLDIHNGTYSEADLNPLFLRSQGGGTLSVILMQELSGVE